VTAALARNWASEHEGEERSYDLVTGRAALSWQASDNATLYATSGE